MNKAFMRSPILNLARVNSRGGGGSNEMARNVRPAEAPPEGGGVAKPQAGGGGVIILTLARGVVGGVGVGAEELRKAAAVELLTQADEVMGGNEAQFDAGG
jgi:hypothetical protein